jgi:hypothetical protein
MKATITLGRPGTGLLAKRSQKQHRSEAATKQKEGRKCNQESIVDETGRKRHVNNSSPRMKMA